MLVLLALGVVLMIAFVFWELFYPYPIMPMSIWRDRDFSIIIAVLLFGFLAFPTMSFWIALFMQQVKGYGPLVVAVHLLPMAIGGITVNVRTTPSSSLLIVDLVSDVGLARLLRDSSCTGCPTSSSWASAP